MTFSDGIAMTRQPFCCKSLCNSFRRRGLLFRSLLWAALLHFLGWWDAAGRAKQTLTAAALPLSRVPRLRFGRPGSVPTLDCLAGPGAPPGLRLSTLPPAAVERALQELQSTAMLGAKVAGPQTAELGRSYYEAQARYGAALKGVLLSADKLKLKLTHPVFTLDQLPGCTALLQMCVSAFQLEGRDVGRANGLARHYVPGIGLPRHIDDPIMFDGPVLAVILQGGSAESTDGLRLCELDSNANVVVAETQGASLRAEPGFRVDEYPGLAVCLEGAARYQFAHQVPAVASPRLSLTWRWFSKDFLERLDQLEGMATPPTAKRKLVGAPSRSTDTIPN
ncbi:unnamed protein product [Polarella glacialis]|uniref:Uncharacterized protein n=1 Tax=Polarella glacialis TaxID=89957 RepID=A0A813D206_POLGL|nr:unnamed protein product [Polarella glacialis]